jgi:peptidoglycan/LPS O-acetylase OafA/YrhL
MMYSEKFLSSYVVGVLVATHFVGIASVAPRLSRAFGRLEGPIRHLAGYTFAAYLFHYPLLQFFAALASGLDDPSLRSSVVVFGTLGAIWALGTITERRKSDVKRWLLSAYEALARKASPGTNPRG